MSGWNANRGSSGHQQGGCLAGPEQGCCPWTFTDFMK